MILRKHRPTGELLKYRHFTRNRRVTSVMAFYEKVIKVKADVAAYLINLLSIGITLRW